MEEYPIVIYALGGTHCFFSFLVLITYFLSNHPTLPSLSGLKQKFVRWRNNKSESEEEVEKVHESKLEVKFFSFTTLYYLVFLGMSVAGIIFQGYFFAFHLLNVVNNNQLLRGVIQAVTQNGKSLLWVAVLGLVVFYLYGLVSFALMRTSFNPEYEMYCSTLWQCTVTVVHYGLVGDIFSKVVSHPAENTFYRFGFLVIFHISFFIFITTIGLNIIFGIIVDTFSELRNLKWTAERDMIDTCFICSRSSYDFEHHGQGFEHHINQEHHIWAYIFFFIHLHDTKQSDYTALELYVHRLLSQEKNDFFPLNRALSLSAMDEDSTESKVDELLRQIHHLVEKQREEDSRKKREEERQKQLRWKEEHRTALLQTHVSMDLHDALNQGRRNSQLKSSHQMYRQKQWPIHSMHSHPNDTTSNESGKKHRKSSDQETNETSSSSAELAQIRKDSLKSYKLVEETGEEEMDENLAGSESPGPEMSGSQSDYMSGDHPEERTRRTSQSLKQRPFQQLIDFSADDPFAPSSYPFIDAVSQADESARVYQQSPHLAQDEIESNSSFPRNNRLEASISPKSVQEFSVPADELKKIFPRRNTYQPGYAPSVIVTSSSLTERSSLDEQTLKHFADQTEYSQPPSYSTHLIGDAPIVSRTADQVFPQREGEQGLISTKRPGIHSKSDFGLHGVGPQLYSPQLLCATTPRDSSVSPKPQLTSKSQSFSRYHPHLQQQSFPIFSPIVEGSAVHGKPLELVSIGQEERENEENANEEAARSLKSTSV